MVELKLDLRTYCECDVFVAGGGPAGCAAAYAAAKQGAKVFLAEAIGCFGGMGTAGLVPFFTGYTDGVHTLCTGFGDLVFDRMEAYNGYGEARGKRRT
ncbi:MAG: FAD-dependent oxidoreductase, partial [Victivallales bacterium]|nr:FAD-dependent oxidoreductase [Victivallales bacterium]